MDTQIFVNLPVTDLQISMDFFIKLGYSFNPNFSDKHAACLVISETIYAMLLVEEFISTFTKKEIVDTRKASEVIIALSAESRAEVDHLIEKLWQPARLFPNHLANTNLCIPALLNTWTAITGRSCGWIPLTCSWAKFRMSG